MVFLLHQTCNFFFFCWFVYRLVVRVFYVFTFWAHINRRLGFVRARALASQAATAATATAAASPFLGYWIRLCKTNNSFSRWRLRVQVEIQPQLTYVLLRDELLCLRVWLSSLLGSGAPNFVCSIHSARVSFVVSFVSKQSANVERSFIYVQHYFVC